jgi:hypothetical protein
VNLYINEEMPVAKILTDLLAFIVPLCNLNKIKALSRIGIISLKVDLRRTMLGSFRQSHLATLIARITLLCCTHTIARNKLLRYIPINRHSRKTYDCMGMGISANPDKNGAFG